MCEREQEGSPWGGLRGELLRWPVARRQRAEEAGFPGVGPATDQTPQLVSSPRVAGLAKATHA